MIGGDGVGKLFYQDVLTSAHLSVLPGRYGVPGFRGGRGLG